MTEVAYETLDVFAAQRFGGNPLAVIADARGLSDEAMRRIACEFNYSETTFVLPAAEPQNTARVRIFTPTNEIPFAGHPNVGTAFVLGRMQAVFGKAAGDAMRFEERAGLVAVTLSRRDGHVIGAAIRAPQTFHAGDDVSVETIAACASLDPHDIAVDSHKPLIASVGLPFAIAQVRSISQLARATPNAAAFREAERAHRNPLDRFSLFLYARLGESRVRARMFAPLSNVLEDPATGSASAALAGLLDSLEPGGAPYALTIEQGVEMGRPSLIETTVEGDRAARCITVSGQCVPVMRGMIAL